MTELQELFVMLSAAKAHVAECEEKLGAARENEDSIRQSIEEVMKSNGIKTAEGAGLMAIRSVRRLPDAYDYDLYLQTLMDHPENFRPSWLHVRDYGLLVANPFGRKAFTGGEASRVEVAAKEPFRLRFGVLVHASAEGPPNLQAAQHEYLK